MPSATIADQRISIEDFPDELLYKIIEFCNSSLALNAIRRSSARFWHLLTSPSVFNFHPWRPMRDIRIKKNFDIHFTQEGDDILDFLYDHQVLLRDGEGELASVKFMGARSVGDRCCYSRFPLNSQIGLLNHYYSKANHISAYFEIEVREASHPASNLRIGLVRGDASSYHPPGSGPYGIGYQSSSGYICLSAHDGDKFQFGPPWKAGDTVGCGYARDSTGHFIVYFTSNGQWVGDAPFDISGQIQYKGLWHAAISSSTPAQVTVNIGQAPFKFDFSVGSLPSFLVSRHSFPRSGKLNCHIIPKEDVQMIANIIPSSSDPFSPATVMSNGTEIIFPDNGFEMARSALSSVPICHLSSNDSFYFEISILEQGEGTNSFLSMGLTVSPASPFHHIGWDRFSIGFHSDDGRVYKESHQNGLTYADPFTTGAVVVGCGYEASEGLVYFTLNGSSLGTAATGFFGKFYAAVAAIRGWRVSVNFGTEPFMYEGAGSSQIECTH